MYCFPAQLARSALAALDADVGAEDLRAVGAAAVAVHEQQRRRVGAKLHDRVVVAAVVRVRLALEEAPLW